MVVTTIEGIEYVHRNEGEPPVAQLTPPRLMPRKRDWGIRYRDGQGEEPFSGSYNAQKGSRAEALREVEQTISVCNDWQLGLTNVMPGR